MNEMELLRELAQETPLPAPGELDAARARLVAAITADPATYATAAAQATVGQPSPSAGQPVDLLRPAAPAPVLTAVKLMYGAAASTAAVFLIAALPFIGDIHGRFFGHRVTTTPLSITLVIVIFGLVPVALWLWMARAVGQGRNWARILSTVLFVLATLELQGEHGVLSVFLAWVTWLTGLAVVWLLWRPASRAFFKRYPVRADHAGITLGPQRYPLASRPAIVRAVGRRGADHPVHGLPGRRPGPVDRDPAPGGRPCPAVRQRAGSLLPGPRCRGRGDPPDQGRAAGP